MLTNQSVERILKTEGGMIKEDLERKASERCIHRHTAETHPNCFRKPALDRLFWYKDLRMGFLDIETSGFEANRNFMLSWALKERGGPTAFDLINKDEIISLDFDRRIVKSCVQAMSNYDILVTYYGTGFDIPFLRTRALINGVPFPIYGQIFHFDVYYRVRALLKPHRKSLDATTNMFGIDDKTHVDIETWMKASYGHKGSLVEVLDHNLIDVEILEKLFDIMEGFSKWTRRSI